MKYTRIYRPPTVVFDMDGTLVDVSPIRHLVDDSFKTKNFDAFHKASVDCPPIDWVVRAAQEAHEMGFRVIQVTARQQKYEKISSFWLAMHGVPSDALYMRANGDFRPDYLVKKDILGRILPSYDILKAYDDNPSIVALWEQLKIPCVVVPGWEG